MVAAFPSRSNEPGNRHPVSRRSSGYILGTIPYLLAVATICYLYTGLFDDQMFNEDYAVYLQQAWNIAHQIPMRDMGVFNISIQIWTFCISRCLLARLYYR